MLVPLPAIFCLVHAIPATSTKLIFRRLTACNYSTYFNCRCRQWVTNVDSAMSMSALPPRATVERTLPDVSKVPLADVSPLPTRVTGHCAEVRVTDHKIAVAQP